MSISRKIFGILPTGESVYTYKIANNKGASVTISTQGAAITELWMPDRNGHFDDVVLGYDTPEEYLKKPKFIGETVGRYGNRIAGGRFFLNGVAYQLDQNNNSNCLHGGFCGFGKKLWEVAEVGEDFVTLALDSPNGECGFPGNMEVQLTFTLDDANTLTLTYQAKSDQDTVCSLAHHSYFNLGGHRGGDISQHLLQVFADRRLDVDEQAIPTGVILPVAETPFDLQTPTPVSALHALIGTDPFITRTKGLDCAFIPNGSGLRRMACMTDPQSGRSMEVFSDLPAFQVYTAGFLDETVVGKGGIHYPQHTGFCMQPEFYPDSPNHPDFPSATLKKGNTYLHKTVFRFSVVSEQ